MIMFPRHNSAADPEREQILDELIHSLIIDVTLSHGWEVKTMYSILGLTLMN